MGGEREGYVESKEKPSKSQETMGSVAGTSGQRLRYHENAGEVHFHDDAIGLKAAVPVAEWWKAWEKLKAQPERWEWVDAKNNTYLVVETQIVGDPPGIEAFTSLTNLVVGPNFQAFNNFTKRK
jgi:hypothetical protein